MREVFVNKTIRSVLIVVLLVLMIGSGGLFTFALTRPGTEYDPNKVKLDVKLVTRERVLTCAHKIYSNTEQNMWVAKTIIKNTGKIPVYDFKISYKIKDYCDWTSGELYPEIVPGETVRDFCWPSFEAEKLEGLTSKTPADLIMKYSYRGKEPVEDYEKIDLMGKNEFVLSNLAEEDMVIPFIDEVNNNMFLAAFVTHSDEAVQQFAGRVGAGLETGTNDQDALEAFIQCFYALREYGLKYDQPPFYLSDATAVQYVQYPGDTLARKTGTCMDLSILYASLMEAVGVRSYVAIIPGHVIPVVQLPISGDFVSIESTFIDKEYALSHFPGLTSPEVTAEECAQISDNELSESYSQGQLILVDVRYWWDAGVLPPW